MLAVSIAGFLALGCSSRPSRAATPPPRLDELAARLSACKLTELATGMAMDPQVADVWKAYPDPGTYVLLVEDGRRALPVRFAAALMLRSVSTVQFKKVKPDTMAHVFAAALRDDLAGYSFPWGWLWAPGDALGQLGQVFPELGPAAQPALLGLLDDDTPRDTYLGSTESTVMAQRHYRVKDFAAFYLSRIANLDVPWEPDLARRDAAIARLRRQLSGGRAWTEAVTSSDGRDHAPLPAHVGGARVRATPGECRSPTSPASSTDGDTVCRRRSLDHH